MAKTGNPTNQQRKAIYKRDGYTCAMCDSTKYLCVHHCIKRSQGGNNSPHNLVTLCADCHALAHGMQLNDYYLSEQEMQQNIVEYLADYYAPSWQPWKWEEEEEKGG